MIAPQKLQVVIRSISSFLSNKCLFGENRPNAPREYLLPVMLDKRRWRSRNALRNVIPNPNNIRHLSVKSSNPLETYHGTFLHRLLVNY